MYLLKITRADGTELPAQAKGLYIHKVCDEPPLFAIDLKNETELPLDAGVSKIEISYQADPAAAEGAGPAQVKTGGDDTI